jgi:hypothetical protein
MSKLLKKMFREKRKKKSKILLVTPVTAFSSGSGDREFDPLHREIFLHF